MPERSARLYVAYLQRLAAWLAERRESDLLEGTSHDLGAYRGGARRSGA